MDPTTQLSLNNRLRDLYGLYYDGQPIYRLVWSETQIEKRWGHFEHWKSGIFLREFTGIAEVPKYPWIKDRWILERRQGHLPNPELPEQISYEPVWVFENDYGPVDPEWWALEVIIKSLSNPRPRSLNDMVHDKSLVGSPAHLAKEKEDLKDKLNDEMSDIQTALRYDEAIVVPEIKTDGTPKLS